MIGNKGFSLVEVIIVIAVIGIVAVFAVPNMIGWRANTNIGAIASNLKSDLQFAKMKAIRENQYVAVSFFPTENYYEIFVDRHNDFSRDSDEDLFLHRQLPADVRIQLTTFNHDCLRFNSRGGADSGQVELVNSKGRQRNALVSQLGKIELTD